MTCAAMCCTISKQEAKVPRIVREIASPDCSPEEKERLRIEAYEYIKTLATEAEHGSCPPPCQCLPIVGAVPLVTEWHEIPVQVRKIFGGPAPRCELIVLEAYVMVKVTSTPGLCAGAKPG
jgi:hypothetical protein